MIKKEYNPSDVGVSNGNYFGMPFSPEESRLVLISVPWDVTASYGGGASSAPDAIIEASTQLDFYDRTSPDEWRKGIGTVPINYSIQDRSTMLRGEAKKVMQFLEEGGMIFDEKIMPRRIERINTASTELNRELFETVSNWLKRGKLVGIVGGDHSVPLGAIRAVAEQQGKIGLLHIDAHCDLRKSYEGFTYSHASIMYNVCNEIEAVERIVQVGVRDYCDDEIDFVANSHGRIITFDDTDMAERLFNGEHWSALCSEIVSALPQKVYVSFDIDGLSPDNCPHTGTPVTGGLSFNQAVRLIDEVVRSGRQIVGFDLVEVAPDPHSQFDAEVGARMLFKMCGMLLKSN
ncbi:MAG: agmatinase family protein [Tidjanibacter sp.]|nr:agmatinase family protein [Tidjanibacter sp.]